jgi:hypothetical protein
MAAASGAFNGATGAAAIDAGDVAFGEQRLQPFAAGNDLAHRVGEMRPAAVSLVTTAAKLTAGLVGRPR